MSLSRKAAGAALVAAIGAGAMIFGGSGAVNAQSQPPAARIFGTITINGQNASSGAIVTAYGTNNTLCGTSTGQGVYNGTVYYVDIDSSQSACNAAGTNLTFKVNGTASSSTTQVPSVPGSAVQLNLTVTANTGPSTVVTYNAGWNLVGGPSGQTFTQAANPLYTFQAGDTNYETVQNSTAIAAGKGYWAYFTASTQVTIQGAAPTGATTISAPAGQYIQVGNPNPTNNVTISGADTVYTYDPVAGQYIAATTLKPGQGAWVLSNAGGTITLQ
jgi:hypothetical protein